MKTFFTVFSVLAYNAAAVQLTTDTELDEVSQYWTNSLEDVWAQLEAEEEYDDYEYQLSQTYNMADPEDDDDDDGDDSGDSDDDDDTDTDSDGSDGDSDDDGESDSEDESTPAAGAPGGCGKAGNAKEIGKAKLKAEKIKEKGIVTKKVASAVGKKSAQIDKEIEQLKELSKNKIE